MSKVRLSRQAAAFLQGLQLKQARQIAEKLVQLSEDPPQVPSEILKGYAPMRRAKSGEFRIVFVFEGGMVEVRLIGKRNDDDIYRALERLTKS